MIRASLIAILALVTLQSAAIAADANLGAYYDELFSGDQLNVTIALPFEQVRSAATKWPVIGKAIEIIESPFRDLKNTRRDVDEIERAVLTCPGCHLSLVQTGKGLRVYTGKFPYADRTIEARIRFIYPEPGVSTDHLKASFEDALEHDSVVIYLGHSRHGVGFPDFATPMSARGKVFRKKGLFKRGPWTGFKNGYFSDQKYQLLALIACKTQEYYLDLLRSQITEKPADKLGLILTTDESWFDDYPGATSALLSGLINQRAPDELLGAMNESADHHNSLRSEDDSLPAGEYVFDRVLGQ